MARASRVGQAVLAFARSYSSSGPNSAAGGQASTACPACGLIPNSTASGALKLIIFQFAFVHVELNTTEWTLEDGPMGDGVYTLIKVGSGTLEPHPHSPPT